jgi:hypothetical protein
MVCGKGRFMRLYCACFKSMNISNTLIISRLKKILQMAQSFNFFQSVKKWENRFEPMI